MKKPVRLQNLLMVMSATGLFGMLAIAFLLLSSLASDLNEQKHTMLQERVEMAENVAKHYYDLSRTGALSQSEAQARTRQILRLMRQGSGEYFWVNDTRAKMIEHPYMPELEGRDVSQVKDSNGKLIVLAFVDTALRQGGGFIAYTWPKPGTNQPLPKLSYVKLFEPWQWVIGCGEYVDDIDEAYWQQVRLVIPLVLLISLLFAAMILWLRRQVLVRVGNDMQAAVSIAGYLSRGEPHLPQLLPAGGEHNFLDRAAEVAGRLFAPLVRGNSPFSWVARRQQADNERRQLSEALKQSYEAIVLATPDLHFSYVNPAFCRLFGYQAGELTGLPVQLLNVDNQPGSNPDEAARIAREGGVFHGEVLRRAKDGRAIPVLIKVAPVVDEFGIVSGYVATMTDLSEIKRAQQALAASEQKFRAIFDQTFQFIGILSSDGKVLDANRSARDISGITPDELIGKYFWETPWWSHSPALQARLRDGIAQAADGHFVRFEADHSDSDGRTRYVDFSLKPVLDEAGQVTLLIPEGHDITERKEAEDAIRQHLEEIIRINAELKEVNDKLTASQSQLLQSEKMASIGVLAAGVAHEINNPVGFIQSNMRTLQKYVADFLQVAQAYQHAEQALAASQEAFAEVRQLKQEIDFDYEKDDVPQLLRESLQGLERVTKIVKDLKDFSHLDTADEWKAEDLHHLLDSTLNIVWNELKYNCTVNKEYGELPPVECLPFQINQVFMNLLVNAAHAIDGHGRGTITLRSGSSGEEAWIEVSDTGQGIAPEHLSQIFDPFFTTKPVGKGTGLGLAVSYSIIEKHHGSIEVSSEPGRGSTFRIRLPIRQQRPAGENAPA